MKFEFTTPQLQLAPLQSLALANPALPGLGQRPGPGEGGDASVALEPCTAQAREFQDGLGWKDLRDLLLHPLTRPGYPGSPPAWPGALQGWGQAPPAVQVSDPAQEKVMEHSQGSALHPKAAGHSFCSGLDCSSPGQGFGKHNCSRQQRSLRMKHGCLSITELLRS